MEIKAESLNEAVILLCRAILDKGVDANRRGFLCKEIPEPVLVDISNPCDRYITIPQRKWNKTLGWIESLWLARGDNSMDMPFGYVKNLMTFSDDGRFMRAGYGPRIRRFGSNGSVMSMTDGSISSHQYGFEMNLFAHPVDQLRFVVEKFKQDIGTREAVITIHDPVADDFDDKGDVLNTKDTPCTRSIHFMVVDGKLNCYVHIRSNDLIWGFSAVNVFNFTLMQEYLSIILDIPVGHYYHCADNMHIYENFFKNAEIISQENILDYPAKVFYYRHDFHSLEEFDNCIGDLSLFESSVRKGGVIKRSAKKHLFKDWELAIERKWNRESCTKFINPILNDLYGLK